MMLPTTLLASSRCRAKIPIKGIERIIGKTLHKIIQDGCRAKIPIKGIER